MVDLAVPVLPVLCHRPHGTRPPGQRNGFSRTAERGHREDPGCARRSRRGVARLLDGVMSVALTVGMVVVSEATSATRS